MTELTLLQAYERFAAPLGELRQRFLKDYAVWLNTALGRDAQAGQAEAAERINATRKRFAQDFIAGSAPGIIRTINRDAARDVVDALESYEAAVEPQPLQAGAVPDPTWHPSLWRTAVGAAFGAVMGVVLLALGHVSPPPPTTPAATQQAPPAPAPVPTNQSPAPGDPTVTPNPSPSPIPAPRRNPSPEVSVPAPAPAPVDTSTAVLWLTAAFAAALGAAIGVVLAASPPLQVVLQRAGLHGGVLSVVRKFGGAFGGILLLLRGSAVIALAAVLLSSFFGILAWMFSGAKLSQVLLVLMALATILAARWTAPGERAPDRDALHRSLVDRLDQYLRADAEVLATLSAALVLRPSARIGTGDPGPARLLKEIVDIIAERRQHNEPAEKILQIVEQNLGLDGGARPPPPSPTIFTWQREHEPLYTTFGVVEYGDLVRVQQQPLFIPEPDGTQRVSQKGVVTRKM